MAFKLINEAYSLACNSTLQEFLCDTDSDFASLPKCSTGSTAVSIESGAVMVVNTQGKWVSFGG